jgi:MoaA/NifB/PqqE/SkfB family radical SAM enzyme
MTKVFSIVPVSQEPFIITWDLGRRCNYDCSYCPAHRHDNFSAHAGLEELKDTAEFLFEYISIIAEQRVNKNFDVSFTGGEPTVNPKFIEFAKYIKSEYTQRFSDKFNLRLDLTTNGAMSQKIADAVIENFDHVTVSYHVEANDKLRELVLERVKQFKDSSIGVKVNVMMHYQYFDHCIDVCNRLTDYGVKFIPRTIGDDPGSRSSQAHLYTDDQKQWLKDQWGVDVTPTTRPCCGGRTFGVCSSTGTSETKIVLDREFQGWHCSVNWYFLHIEQQTGLVYHHQTCQATLDNKRGSIGSLTNTQEILATINTHIENKTMPLIVCPNKLCGCGLCTPKSKFRHNLLEVMPKVVRDVSIFSVD